MNRTLSFFLAFSVLLALLLPGTASAEDRVVLTIGDVEDRSNARMDGENQLGLWQYLEDQLNVEIQFVHLTPEAYAAGLSSGNLPDIVAAEQFDDLTMMCLAYKGARGGASGGQA